MNQQLNQHNNETKLLNLNPSPIKQLETKSGTMLNTFQSTNGAINILETLQSKLKQKEGEILQLQVFEMPYILSYLEN